MQKFWGYIVAVEAVSAWMLRIHVEGGSSFLCQRRLTPMTPPGPQNGSKWSKAMEWYWRDGIACVTHLENRAADAVPVDLKAKTYYLIKRNDSGLLAVPGGFIDVEDGINRRKPIVEIAAAAAARELMEETGSTAERFLPLGPSMRERLDPSSGQKPREFVTRTWPFAAVMSMKPLAAGDDAAQAPGEPGLPPGWYRLASPIPSGFHFSHHIEILKRLKNAVLAKKWPKTIRGDDVLRGQDLSRVRGLQRHAEMLTRRDYDLLSRGLTPILGATDAVQIDMLQGRRIEL